MMSFTRTSLRLLGNFIDGVVTGRARWIEKSSLTPFVPLFPTPFVPVSFSFASFMMAAAMVTVGGSWAEIAYANPIVAISTAAGWVTTRKISGNVGADHVGETITITYPAGTVPASQSATVNANGGWVIFPPKTVPAATAATITSTIPGCPGPTPTTVAQLLNPPANFATANHVILAGLASVNGTPFDLTGGYTVTATAFDSDPASPTFGNLSGAILASSFAVSGTGSVGTIDLALISDQPFTVSMLPVLTASDPIGSSISFDFPVSGEVTFNSLSSPFSGFVQGTSTYGEDGAETYFYSLNLTSIFGPITGSVSSFGVAQVVPEPSTVLLFGSGLAGLVAWRWRRLI